MFLGDFVQHCGSLGIFGFNHSASVAFYGFFFDRWRIEGHHDVGGYFESGAYIRHSLAVVSRRIACDGWRVDEQHNFVETTLTLKAPNF
jgi:hypothetical protein